MGDYKLTLGYLATIISFVSYVPYFKSIFSGQTRPHAFSWFIWSLLTAIAFFAQLSKGGGSGSWVTASTAIACFAVFIVALFKGQKKFSKFDWWALAGALFSIVLWQMTKNPTITVILVTLIDLIGFLPTFRKAYYYPMSENLSLYSASTFKYILGTIALKTFNLSTWLFPVSLILSNGLFVVMVALRRKTLKRINATN